MNSSHPSFTPSSVKERIVLIDALRGFALLGVCLANLAWFSGVFFMSEEQAEAMPLYEIDRFFYVFIFFFVDGKFITLFSMLFGLGFGIIMKRAEERGIKGQRYFVRRLFVLLLFGLAHITFWHGDILTWYALFGFALLLFRKKKGKSLIRWGIVLGVAIPFILMAVMMLFMNEEQVETIEKLNAATVSAFQSGSFSEVIAANLKALTNMLGKMLVFMTFFGIGRFLFGYWTAKHGLFFNPQDHIELLQKTKRVTGWIGFPSMIIITVLAVLTFLKVIPEFSKFQSIFSLYTLATLGLGIYYTVTFALLFQKDKWRRRLMIFQPMGRMALTNYLMQTIINVPIFYGFGIGLMGKVGGTIYFLWFLVLITLQILFSRWWLQRFYFGPFEWLWRSISYGKWQKFVIKPEVEH